MNRSSRLLRRLRRCSEGSKFRDRRAGFRDALVTRAAASADAYTVIYALRETRDRYPRYARTRLSRDHSLSRLTLLARG